MAKRNPDDGEVAIESKNHKNGSYDEVLDDANDDDDDDDEEEDDEQQHRRKKDKKKKKKKKRVRIMHASGQTDADRRILRRRLRELHTEISFDGPVAAAAAVRRGGTNDSSCDEDDERMEERTTKSSSSSSGLQSWREKNNALWNDVRFTREAVLDSENMDLISSKAAREVEKIIQVRERERESVCVCVCVINTEVNPMHIYYISSIIHSFICIIIPGSTLRCRHSSPKPRQKGIHPKRRHPPIPLGRSWFPSGGMFQFTPLQLFLPLRTTRCRFHAQGTEEGGT
jgi:hypothetical protein